MLVLLPIFVLLLAVGAVLLTNRMRPGFGPAWLVNIGLVLLSWIIVLVMRWQVTAPLVISDWLPLQTSSGALLLSFDSISWPYAFALVSVVLAVMLTLPIRLPAAAEPDLWARNLGLASMGLLSVLSASPLAFLLSWAAIDLMELVIRLNLVEESPADSASRAQIALAFGVRVGGSICLIVALISSAAAGSPLTFLALEPQIGLWVLLAAGLRLGVLPLNLPFVSEDPRRRGLGTLLRLVSAASSLALLARLPQNSIPPAWQPFLLAFCTLAALYGSAMWVASRDSLNGRPYWLIALAALSIGCVVQNAPNASLPWGLALLLVGSVLFLYSAHDRRALAFPILAILLLPGLPFTPFGGGWSGLLPMPFNAAGLVFLISVGLLTFGAVRPLLRTGGELAGSEGWVRVVYPLGLLIPSIAAWLIGATQTGSLSLGRWWAAPLTLLFASFSMLLFHRPVQRSGPQPWLDQAARRAGQELANFLNLNWAYRLLWWLYRQIEKLINLLSLLLEGDGGVLWVLVLLALLLSLLRQAGNS